MLSFGTRPAYSSEVLSEVRHDEEESKSESRSINLTMQILTSHFLLNSTAPTDPAHHQPACSYTLLASCMHAGTRIVQLSRSGDEWEFTVQAKFEEHKSMNYGSDVQPLIGNGGASGEEKKARVIVSTSFYDKLMCVWRV